MKYLLLICADEDADVASEGALGMAADTASRAAGTDGGEVRFDAYADLDEAIGSAGRHPVVRFGAVDVRPAWCR